MFSKNMVVTNFIFIPYVLALFSDLRWIRTSIRQSRFARVYFNSVFRNDGEILLNDLRVLPSVWDPQSYCFFEINSKVLQIIPKVISETFRIVFQLATEMMKFFQKLSFFIL